jgi:hypothetical protein
VKEQRERERKRVKPTGRDLKREVRAAVVLCVCGRVGVGVGARERVGKPEQEGGREGEGTCGWMKRLHDDNDKDDFPQPIAPTSTIAFPRRFTNYIPIELRGPHTSPPIFPPPRRNSSCTFEHDPRSLAPPGFFLLSSCISIYALGDGGWAGGGRVGGGRQGEGQMPCSRNAFNLPRFGILKASASASFPFCPSSLPSFLTSFLPSLLPLPYFPYLLLLLFFLIQPRFLSNSIAIKYRR